MVFAIKTVKVTLALEKIEIEGTLKVDMQITLVNLHKLIWGIGGN